MTGVDLLLSSVTVGIDRARVATSIARMICEGFPVVLDRWPDEGGEGL